MDLPFQRLYPNGTYDGAPAYIVDDVREFEGRNVLIEASGGGRCDLVIANGGNLLVRNGKLEVRGNVQIEEGGFTLVQDAQLQVLSSYPVEHNFWFRGGLLHTQDAAIGGAEDANGASYNSIVYLNRGHWTARETVVKCCGGIMFGQLDGHGGKSAYKGGTLDADGMHAGKSADYVILSGRGDATIRNSTVAIRLSIWADIAGSAELDFDTERPVAHRVYGDRNVHDANNRSAVTNHIAGSPWRLELENVRVTQWSLAMRDATQNGPDFRVSLRNTNNATLRVMGENLRGSPELIGPWRTFYPAPRKLPGLPSSRSPGSHGIPPGCGVTIGNVTLAAPDDQWAYPGAWEFNFTGSGTDFAIRGSHVISEIFMNDARVTFEGDGQYNAGLRATRFDVLGASRLILRNATIGAAKNIPAEILAAGTSVVEMEGVVIDHVLLRTRVQPWGPLKGVDQARIIGKDFIVDGHLEEEPSRGGSIEMSRSTAEQGFDLANMDFTAGLISGKPRHWLASGVAGWISGVTRPGAKDSRSYQFKSASSSSYVRKTVHVAPESTVEFSGWIRLREQLPNGAAVKAFVRGVNGHELEVAPDLVLHDWVHFRVPSFEVGPSEAPITFGVRGANGLVDFLLDDCELRIARWWNEDNLANLDFDGAYNHAIPDPVTGGSLPDFWSRYSSTGFVETSQRRPGAAWGSRSMRLVSVDENIRLYKRLSFLQPGQTVVFKGWVRGLSHSSGPYTITAAIGEDPGPWWDITKGNNVRQQMADGAWRQFELVYTVPSGSAKSDFTRFNVTTSEPGVEILVDDFTLEVR